MDTGPREGDIYIINDYEPGTPDWYDVEKGNAIYRQRNSWGERGFRGDPLGLLMWKLILKNNGKPMGSVLLKF